MDKPTTRGVAPEIDLPTLATIAAVDATAVGLAVQITQLHHDGVSNEEIQGSLQNLCRAQGMDEPAAQERVQEAFHIWSTMRTALQRAGLSNVSTP